MLQLDVMREKISNEAEMMKLGERVAGVLGIPVVIELVGDVGAGKTTFVKGLARGLGVEDEVTSPSFTINKRYVGKHGVELSHYDFYRLSEAGLMKAELEESMGDENMVTVVEWADSVSGVLGEGRVVVRITMLDEKSRMVEISGTEIS